MKVAVRGDMKWARCAFSLKLGWIVAVWEPFEKREVLSSIWYDQATLQCPACDSQR